MSVHHRDDTLTLVVGEAAEQLATVPAGSVGSVVTSPPYYGQRDYGVTKPCGCTQTEVDQVIGWGLDNGARKPRSLTERAVA